MAKYQVEVPHEAGLEQTTQLGVRFPDGTIIWAELGKDFITAPWSVNDRQPLIYIRGKSASYYDQHYAWTDATPKYHEHLAKLGANYDPEHDVLERVSRQVILVTTQPTVAQGV